MRGEHGDGAVQQQGVEHLFLATFRRMPTANAGGGLAIESAGGRRKKRSSGVRERVFRATLQIGTGPRRFAVGTLRDAEKKKVAAGSRGTIVVPNCASPRS